MPLKSHLSTLEECVNKHPDLPFYRILVSDGSTPHTCSQNNWKEVTYRQFFDEVCAAGTYWTHILTSKGLPPANIIAAWITGMDYHDIVLVFGLSWAGYVVHLLSTNLTSEAIVIELLQKSSAKALITENSEFSDNLHFLPIVHKSMAKDIAATHPAVAIVPQSGSNDASDVAFIFQTSGSTGNSPKLVPCTFGWINALWPKMAACWTPSDVEREVVSCMGSITHVGQWFTIQIAMQHAACVLQPTSVAFSASELQLLIREGGLTRLFSYTAFLQQHLFAAKVHPLLESQLRSLCQIMYTGLGMMDSMIDYASSAGMRVTNLFGSTEVGPMLFSVDHSNPRKGLRPLPGTSYVFKPVVDDTKTQASLGELVVTSISPDRPQKAFLDHSGNFATGDIFEMSSDGIFIPRGRNDDWIKSKNGLRCDAKAIEDNALQECGDLIQVCTVIGNGRPSPALLVEPRLWMDDKLLPETIIRRIAKFHERRYTHERITNPSLVIVVEPGSLPLTSTKRSVRRQIAEAMFKEVLDGIYS